MSTTYVIQRRVRGNSYTKLTEYKTLPRAKEYVAAMATLSEPCEFRILKRSEEVVAVVRTFVKELDTAIKNHTWTEPSTWGNAPETWSAEERRVYIKNSKERAAEMKAMYRQDRRVLRTVRDLTARGKMKEAMKMALKLDACGRSVIPNVLWGLWERMARKDGTVLKKWSQHE